MKTCCGRLFATDTAFDAHGEARHLGGIPIAVAGRDVAHAARHVLWDIADVIAYTECSRNVSTDKRKKLASSGAAMSDGSFPIENEGDLKNAIRAVGRASNPASAKAHIKKRAKALGKTALLPDDWSAFLSPPVDVNDSKSPIINPNVDQNLPFKCPYCGRKFEEQLAETLHEQLVHKDKLNAAEHPQVVGKQTQNSGDASARTTKIEWVDKADADGDADGTTGAPTSGDADEIEGGSADIDQCPIGGCGFSGIPSAMLTHLGSPAHDQVDKHLVEHYKRKKKATEGDKADRPESFDDIRSAVQDAISDMFLDPMSGNTPYIWIADISDSWVIFEVRSDYYKLTYTMDDNGKVTLSGPPQAVQRRTIYVPDPDGDNDD